MITLTEVVSNIKRLSEVDGLISSDQSELIIKAFLGELGSGRLHTVEAGAQVIISSLELCSDQYMTPLDAIQLASALSLAETNPVFLCSNLRLNKLARSYGLPVINPAD